MIKEWASEIGISLQLALAGFWGGVVHALIMRRVSLIEVLTAVVVGMMTANYLGGVAVKYTGAPELATGFIVGLSGMIICRGIISAATSFKFGRDQGTNNAP